MADKNILFCTVCDDLCVKGLAVLLHSLQVNMKGFESIPFKIFYNSSERIFLSDHWKLKIERCFRNVIFCDVTVKAYSKAKAVVPTQKAAYLSIEAFRQDYRSVIYLDCDMLCLNDFLHVLDVKAPFLASACTADEGFVDSDINTGFFVLNGLENREWHYCRMIDIMIKEENKSLNTDQWVINKHFNKIDTDQKIYVLPLNYNYTRWGGIRKEGGLDKGVISGQTDELNINFGEIFLLHYSGYEKRLKPWHEIAMSSNMPAYKIWRRYYEGVK